VGELKIPAVSCEEMREIDRRAIEEYGIPVETLMENAGKSVAEQCLMLLDRLQIEKPWKIVVCCGGGNNGGDGLVAARLLKQRGIEVNIILLKPTESFKGATLLNFEKIKDEVPYEVIPNGAKIKNDLASSALILDALLGTGFKGDVEGIFREMIELINRSGRPVVSVDIPSGLDADDGKIRGVSVRANLTVTMGAMKKGFLTAKAEKKTGEVVVADIGFPKELIV